MATSLETEESAESLERSMEEEFPTAQRQKLTEMAASTIIQSLGKIATGRFTCGGTLRTPTKVQLNYLNKTGQWSYFSWS